MAEAAGRFRGALVVLILLLCVGSLFLACARTPKPALPEPPPALPAGPAVSYESDVKPVLERRCVVCHGCYDAPCQLLLSSYEGITRGASKNAVYDSSRLETAPPTRLFVDASSTAEWRERGFHAVVEEQMGAGAGGWSSALLERMIALGHSHPLPANEKLPKSVFLDIQRPLHCATREEFDDYAANNPWGGMPYGIAPLSDEEFLTLERWLSQGAPGPPPAAALPPDLEVRVHTWETFFNGSSNKEKLAARYLYEHLFAAHLYFEDGTPGHYFELVRSRTAPGKPIDVIATARPYDDPGDRRSTIGCARSRERSFTKRTSSIRSAPSGWRVTAPSSSIRIGTWRRCPPTRKRLPPIPSSPSPPYRHARVISSCSTTHSYFVMTFIRGPVCRGQIAVDVIDDRFWVSFLDPNYDLSITDPTLSTCRRPIWL